MKNRKPKRAKHECAQHLPVLVVNRGRRRVGFCAKCSRLVEVPQR